MFGGANSSNLLNDAWSLSLTGTPHWAPLVPTGTPPTGRSYSRGVYDDALDRLTLFGGFTGSGFSDETWSLSLAGSGAWSNLAIPGPAGRYGHDVDCDAIGHRMFIGFGYDGAQFRTDTWALSLSGSPAWSEIQPGIPAPRTDHTAIYDPVRHRMVMFGGTTSLTYSPGTNETWALELYSGGVWEHLVPAGTPPSSRSGSSAIYDPVRDRMVVFGGGGTHEVWQLALSGAPTWSSMMPSGTAPSSRDRQTAIYDPVRDRMIIFGGDAAADGASLNDAWTLSLNGATPAWTKLAMLGTPPAVRYGHSAIYDPVRDRMLVFGGWTASRDQGTWALSLSGAPTWTQLSTAGSPPGYPESITAIYDSDRDRMVCYGGGYVYQDNRATALSLAGTPTWTQLAPTGGGGSRSEHVAIYDAAHQRMVVSGGRTDGGVTFHQMVAPTSLLSWAPTTDVGDPATSGVARITAVTPNPGAGRTSIGISLTAYSSRCELEIFTIGGQRVWSRTSLGTPVPAGIYFARLREAGASRSAGSTSTVRFVRLR